MHVALKSSRLSIEPLASGDKEFIFELLNTEGWIRFIGDRNITSVSDAAAYIKKIVENPATLYWVVKLAEEKAPVGIVTFIKRNYLEHHDIGFAFLPQFANRGYAYEAATAVLNNIVQSKKFSAIKATTVADNSNSIKLLKKLGLRFENEIEVDKEKLQVYGIATAGVS